MMTEIGVHRDDIVIAALLGILKASDERSSQALFPGTMKNLNPIVAHGKFIRQISRAIWRIVVNDQDVGCWQERVDLLEQGSQIFSLIVGRDGD